ncbi:MAG: hypothetical protein A4E60_00465 [Syntrophorhabdus sp. PtaB.Bin047]|nr:MAG: hypothetical protein A4E60_00465 [Syntrophorhabdus sp. PtaB.Bin047]
MEGVNEGVLKFGVPILGVVKPSTVRKTSALRTRRNTGRDRR